MPFPQWHTYLFTWPDVYELCAIKNQHKHTKIDSFIITTKGLLPYRAVEILTVTSIGFIYAAWATVIFYQYSFEASWWWIQKRPKYVGWITIYDGKYIVSVCVFWRTMCRQEDNIKMDLQEVGFGVWTGSSWFRIGIDGRHLWMLQWTFSFHKMWGISCLA